MGQIDFRNFVPAPGTSRIAAPDARGHARARLGSSRAAELFSGWETLFAVPYRGVTTDGAPIPGLFERQSEGAPSSAMRQAAATVLSAMGPAERARGLLAVDSSLWRRWQNTELLVETHGLRLDEVSVGLREAILQVLRTSLSAAGYTRARRVMQLNAFLGQLVDGPGVMGEWSYTFCLFGEPRADEPWGWQLFGHHLALSCLLLGDQMVLSPTFMGAEPCYDDSGPFAGMHLFQDEQRAGLGLMRTLEGEQRARAIVADSLLSPTLPPGRRHFADGLQLGAAYQDNRIIPLEGVPGSSLGALQRRSLLDLIEAYVSPLPAGPLAHRMRQIEDHLDATHFCWVGGTAEDSTFYYRVQSPVLLIEFDHHAGVYLTNAEPQPFHVHTIVRTPNGNDYGHDLLRQHYEQAARAAQAGEGGHLAQHGGTATASARSHDHGHGHSHSHDHSHSHSHAHDHTHDHGHAPAIDQGYPPASVDAQGPRAKGHDAT